MSELDGADAIVNLTGDVPDETTTPSGQGLPELVSMCLAWEAAFDDAARRALDHPDASTAPAGPSRR